MTASIDSKYGEPLHVKPVIRSDRQIALTWVFPSGGRSAVLVERSVDGGQWVQIASLGGSAVNYTDNGVAPDHRYQYRVRGRGAAYTPYTTTGYLYTTPAAPKSVSVTRKSASTGTVSIAGGARWPEAYKVQTSTDGSSWGSEVEVPGFPADIDLPVGGASVRVAARRNAKVSGWTSSQVVAGPLAPPLAPSVGRIKGSFALPADVPVTWTPNHPDGSAQSAAEVELTSPGGSTSVTTVNGPEPGCAVEVTEEGMHSVRVRTKGLHRDWGEWSSKVAFMASTAPNAYFTNPAVDGLTVTSMPLPLEWSVDTPTGVVSQSVTIRTADGTVLHTEQLDPDARSFTLSADTYMPPSGGSYVAVIDAVDGSSLRTHGERRFATDYAEPVVPACSVYYGGGGATAMVTVRHAASSWDVDGDGDLVAPGYWDGTPGRIGMGTSASLPSGGVVGLGAVIETTSVSVARLGPDGSRTVIDDDLIDGGTAIDRLPPLNSPFEYLVTAYGPDGSASYARVPALVECEGEVYNFGADASTSVELVFDADAETTVSQGGELFHFALGPDTPHLPEYYPDGTSEASGSRSYVVVDAQSYRRLDAIRRDPSNAVCWYRDHWGGRARVRAEWGLGYSSSSYSLWTVRANVTEVMWRDPSNG